MAEYREEFSVNADELMDSDKPYAGTDEYLNTEELCGEEAPNEAVPNEAPCCCSRKKVRSEKEYKDLMNRLSRIEGQIRGLKRMLDEDAYCIDIINQVSAANCALNSFTKVILANHIKSCVAEDVKEGNEEKLDELVKTLQKLMK